MAGFMDMLGKRPEGEGVSSYQKTVMKEIARKLIDLEEQNDQNAAAIEEIKKLQKMILQKMDAMTAEQAGNSWQAPVVHESNKEELEELKKQVNLLTQQLHNSVQSMDNQIQESIAALDGRIQESLLDKLDTVKLSIEDTVHKENIKCYRNVQGALEEQGDGKEYDVKGLKKYLKVIVWFQLITIAIVVLQIFGLL